MLGQALADAGDVDADGYADLIVNAGDDVLLFHGGAQGIAGGGRASADAVLAARAFSVASAGDVDGDGDADVVVGDPSYDGLSQTDIGRFFLFRAEGRGRSVFARALRGDGSGIPVLPWSGAASADGFEVELVGSHPEGTGRVRARVEVCGPGVPFGDASCLVSFGAAVAVGPAEPEAALAAPISGLAPETPYRWRAAVQHAPPVGPLSANLPHGPWRRVQAQAVEADLRTGDGANGPACGDGAVDSGEECDDGNVDAGRRLRRGRARWSPPAPPTPADALPRGGEGEPLGRRAQGAGEREAVGLAPGPSPRRPPPADFGDPVWRRHALRRVPLRRSRRASSGSGGRSAPAPRRRHLRGEALLEGFEGHDGLASSRTPAASAGGVRKLVRGRPAPCRQGEARSSRRANTASGRARRRSRPGLAAALAGGDERRRAPGARERRRLLQRRARDRAEGGRRALPGEGPLSAHAPERAPGPSLS